MGLQFAHHEPFGKGLVRTYGNDIFSRSSHNPNMARRGVPERINWYLPEWMDYLGVKQADMVREAGWSKASASQLYNGVQDYSPKLVNEAAKVLNLEPFELLMRPEAAMAYRRHRAEALKEAKLAEVPKPPTTGSRGRKAG